MNIDMTTDYGGLILKNPIVVGACPLMASERSRNEVESAGAAAIVLPSLFEEHVVRWNEHRRQADPPPPLEDQSLQDEMLFGHDPWTYLSFVNRSSVNSAIPVLASINGSHAESWIRFACELEEVGASGIELNIYPPPVEEVSDPRELEDNLVSAVRKIREAVLIPIFVKLCRHYTSIPHLVKRLSGVANGVVMFGREPDLDISTSDMKLRNQWGLTDPGTIVHSLGPILRTHKYCPEMSIAANGGIGSGTDMIKSLLAGADVAMITSSIYRESPSVISTLLQSLRVFMEYQQASNMKELTAVRPVGFTTEKEREQYRKSLANRVPPGQTILGAQVRP